MQPTISFITLGVDNLERALTFYRDGLGLQTDGILGQEPEHGAVVFIDFQPGLRLALWSRSSIARETGLPVCTPCPTNMMLAHNVSSKTEVGDIMQAAERAGANITKLPSETFWGGYAGYFQDPDGHIWEIVWNPAWKV